MIAFDSVTAADIPADAPFVIGWGDGRYRWSQADWDRFSTPFKQSVVGDPASDGDWLDVEPGLASASDCAAWVVRQRANPWWPGGIYTNWATIYPEHGWGPVIAALRAAGVGPVRLWIAYELASLPAAEPPFPAAWLAADVVLWQYALSPGISPGHFDLSAIAPDYLPSIPPAPDQGGTTMGEITYGELQGPPGPNGESVMRPAIFYPAETSRNPTAIVQMDPPDPTHPFGIFEWADLSAAADTVNGTPPPVAPG